MYEILIRIESLCLKSPSTILVECGLLVLILGILLWLAGSYFSVVIVGLLGAVAGSVCGLLVSQRLTTPAMISMLIGALVFTIAAALFRNVLIILLATLLFGLAGVTVYSSLILKEASLKTYSSLNLSFVQPFSQMDTSTQLTYVNRIVEKEESFLERSHLLLKETLQTASLRKWDIIFVALLGGIAGMLLSWSLRKPIMALCYSGVGTFMVLIGLEVVLLGMNVHFISWFQERQEVLTITYLSMVGIGVIYQLKRRLSSKQKRGPTKEKYLSWKSKFC